MAVVRAKAEAKVEAEAKLTAEVGAEAEPTFGHLVTVAAAVDLVAGRGQGHVQDLIQGQPAFIIINHLADLAPEHAQGHGQDHDQEHDQGQNQGHIQDHCPGQGNSVCQYLN